MSQVFKKYIVLSCKGKTIVGVQTMYFPKNFFDLADYLDTEQYIEKHNGKIITISPSIPCEYYIVGDDEEIYQIFFEAL